MASAHPHGAAAPIGYALFDQVSGKWATPFPASHPTTKSADLAALFPSEESAASVAIRLEANGHDSLALLPLFPCACCGKPIALDVEASEPENGPVSGIAPEGPEGLHYSWYKGEFPGLPHLA